MEFDKHTQLYCWVKHYKSTIVWLYLILKNELYHFFLVEGICADCDLDYELQLLLFGLVQNCHLQLYMVCSNGGDAILF